jgi:hypothetical protein
MYHILNNYISFQYGGFTPKLQKRLYISAFTYILLLFIYSLESAAYLKGEKAFKKIKETEGFFAIYISFSVLIPIIMLILIFGVVVKKSAESWINIAIWALMALHLGLTLGAFIISEDREGEKVPDDLRGFAYTRLIFLFIAMALALQGGKVHNKIKYGSVGESRE